MNLQTGDGSILPFRVMRAISVFDNAGFLGGAGAAENGISSSETLVCWFGYIISRGDIGSGEWPLQ